MKLGAGSYLSVECRIDTIIQESPANAKVRARDSIVYRRHLAKKSTANQRREHNVPIKYVIKK